MAKHINVRYSLNQSDHETLLRIQQIYEQKLGVSKLSQTDALRFMMKDVLNLHAQLVKA